MPKSYTLTQYFTDRKMQQWCSPIQFGVWDVVLIDENQIVVAVENCRTYGEAFEKMVNYARASLFQHQVMIHHPIKQVISVLHGLREE